VFGSGPAGTPDRMSERDPEPEEQSKDPIEERLTPTVEDDGETKPAAPGEATTTGTPPNNR
jgi:hypothetical protein